MEIQEYINQKKSLYENLLSFINDEEDSDDYFRNLLENFQAQRLDQNREELKLLLYLLLKISKNHHRTPLFFEKIQRIISHFKNSIKQFFTNSEIFNIFIHSKPILLFLISSQIIIIDETVIDLILKYKDKGQFKYCHFFYPEIQSAVEKMKDVYKEDIEEFDHFIFTNFEENRKIGENHYLICKLIREDSVEDFISYITENKINVTSKITKSIFETNSLLIKNEETTLIEYAAFFGSFQIFQYLLLNNATVKPSIWIYAIHGKNPEIIHLLEYNNITPEDNNYDKCYIESIKCHHNDIADYISNSFFNRIENRFKNSYFHYYNYFYFQDDLNTIDDFFLACEYDYFSIVDFFLNSKSLTLQKSDILIFQNFKNYVFFYYLFLNSV